MKHAMLQTLLVSVTIFGCLPIWAQQSSDKAQEVLGCKRSGGSYICTKDSKGREHCVCKLNSASMVRG